MGVYIKSMEMPSECWECPLIEGNTWCKSAGRVLAENYRPIQFDGRPKWCPLVEVPEPHGRLIDSDKLIIDLMDRGLEGIQTDDYSEIQQTIIVQDTVIEAEGE